MSSNPTINVATSEDHFNRVSDSLKKTLEGELIQLATVYQQEDSASHSKSSSHYHSRSGHCFSRFESEGDEGGKEGEESGEKARFSVDEETYNHFVSELVAAKSSTNYGAEQV